MATKVGRGILAAAALAALAAGGGAGLAAAEPGERAAPSEVEVRVAAAADLRPALELIAAGFEAEHPGVRVRARYAASGALFAQIRNGAAFDLFLSADSAKPRRLVEEGLGEPPPFPFASGRLALWVPNGSRLDVERLGLAALRDPSVHRVAIANPAVAPYGAAAEAALKAAGVHDAVREKLVLGQSAQQAAQFAQTGSAEAGILPMSLARASPLAAEGRFVPVPPGDHPPIEQAGVVLKGARSAPAARALAAWLVGPRGRAVLERFGYGAPGAGGPGGGPPPGR
jgi:molybdate transport system substrate-binding protein